MANKQEVQHALQDFYAKPAAAATLELFLSIGLVIILGIFAIQPTLITMTELNKEIEEKTTLSEQLDRKITALQTASSLYASFQSRISVLDEALPSQPQLIKTVKIIEKLATDNRVVIESLNVPRIPDEVTPPSTIALERQVLPITVSVLGDYVSIRNYVEDLRASRRTFVVETVTFNLQENRGSQRLSASITLNAPYFGE